MKPKLNQKITSLAKKAKRRSKSKQKLAKRKTRKRSQTATKKLTGNTLKKQELGSKKLTILKKKKNTKTGKTTGKQVKAKVKKGKVKPTKVTKSTKKAKKSQNKPIVKKVKKRKKKLKRKIRQRYRNLSADHSDTSYDEDQELEDTIDYFAVFTERGRSHNLTPMPSQTNFLGRRHNVRRQQNRLGMSMERERALSQSLSVNRGIFDFSPGFDDFRHSLFDDLFVMSEDYVNYLLR